MNKKIIIFIIIFLLLFIYKYNKCSSIDKKLNYYDLSICNIQKKDEYIKYTTKINNEYIIVYDYNNTNYIPGDTVRFYGALRDISNFSDFDYETYMKSKNVYLSMTTTESIKLSHKNDYYYFKYALEERYNNYFDDVVGTYFNSLLFAENIDNLSLSDSINELGISYLFCISGFHITLLAFFVEKIFELIFKQNSIIDALIIICLFLYSFLCGFQIGVLRAFIMFTIFKLNKNYNLMLTKLDIVSISFLLCLLINPLFIFQTAFKYSFIVTFFIILGSSLIKTDNFILKIYLIGVLCFFASLPISVNINYQINLLTLIIGPIYVFVFSFFTMPLVYMIALFPALSNVLSNYFVLFNNSIINLATLNVFKIDVSYMPSFSIILYYVLFFLLLVSFETKKYILKYLSIFSFFIFILISLKNIYPLTTLTMINVNQGDSFMIRDKDDVMLIDSFGVNVNYLKKCGINNIDTMLLTHSDNDHIGSALEICKNMNVNTLILSKFDDSNKTKEISLYCNKTLYLKAKDRYYFSNNLINILGPVVDLNSVNNNCLVFDITLKNKTILFTGDMEEEEENTIFKEKMKFDILKVPHHGSNSSMGELFMKNVSFNVALISVGKQNKYNFPSNETINKLKNKKVYMTSVNMSTIIYFKENDYFIYPLSINKYFLYKIKNLTF